MTTPTIDAPQAGKPDVPIEYAIFLFSGADIERVASWKELDDLEHDDASGFEYYYADPVDVAIFGGASIAKFATEPEIAASGSAHLVAAYRLARRAIGDTSLAVTKESQPGMPQARITIEGDAYLLSLLEVAALAKGGRVTNREELS